MKIGLKGIFKPLAVLGAVVLCLSLALAAAPVPVAATTFDVGPGKTYTTIQSAITAASDGDTINVAPGTYLETIDITKDNLTIQAVSGNPEDTIIDANGANDSIVDLTNRSGVTISGFTIKGAKGLSGYYYGVKMENASGCTLSNSVITAIESAGYNTAGICLNNATDNNFDSVTVSDITCPGNTIGVSIWGDSKRNSFSSTAVSNLEGGSTYAFEMIGSDSNTVKSTTISNLTATTNSYGFYIRQSDDNSFIDTDISNLIGNHSTFGIQLTLANDNTFSSINISNLEDGYQVIGIFLFQRSSDNSFESIEISGVTATGPDASGHGIAIDAISCNNNFHEITIFDITGGSATGGASGISLAYSETKDNSFSEYDISDLDGANTDGISINSGASNSFSGGSITGAQNGVHVSGDALSNSIHFTNIYGNTEYGVKNENVSAILDATNNWWGDASGPSHDGVVAGDAVFGNVDYDPWLGAAIDLEETVVKEVTISAGGTEPVVGPDGSAINSAINQITVTGAPDTTVTVVAATYEGNPAGTHGLQAQGYYDVHLSSMAGVTSVAIEFAGLPNTIVYYWDKITEEWLPCSNQEYAGGVVTVTIRSGDATPGLGYFSGGPVMLATTPPIGGEAFPISPWAANAPLVALGVVLAAGAGVFVWRRARA